MSDYREERRYRCLNDGGKTYVVIQQIRISGAALPKTDYMTEDGEIVNRLDDDHFLLLLDGQVLHIPHVSDADH
ncbi:hypothetical protein [Rhizobium mesoamericanum]|uniref:hypothetical protein n=1 Tax=Rhizobium mesoamericanum TaxID=1079800 RepID=UPI0002F0C24B|nr:hypothetical protein [Rhizobium mesoamericanum]